MIRFSKAYCYIGIDLNSKEDADGRKRDKGKAQGSEVDLGRRKMCGDYYDVRAFGAVMSTGTNAGQVRGPVQLTFARSVDPIVALEHSITRMAVATQEEAADQGGDKQDHGPQGDRPGTASTLGTDSCPRPLPGTPGSHRTTWNLLWTAIGGMFELDRSAARGLMTMRRLFVFQHESHLGNASAASLFETITIGRRQGVEAARLYGDYEIVARGPLPAALELLEWNGKRLERRA